MSTRSFVNALIGLAREHKKAERRAINFNLAAEKRGAISRKHMPHFGHTIAVMMQEHGYFTQANAEVFGDAIESLLQSSTPERPKS